jgi:hypothetical protein
MADTDLSIAVRWAESGADVPTRTTASLRTLHAAAGDASASIGDRLGTAFSRLEAREPTMVLRRSALAMEALGASAIGVEGPLGRLALTLPLLFGPAGLLAIGVLAAAGGAMKALADHTAAFAAEMDKLGTAIERTQLGGGARAGLATKVSDLREQIGKLGEPGTWEKVAGGINAFFTGGIMGPATRALGLTTVFGQAAEGEGTARGIEQARIRQLIDALEADFRESESRRQHLLIGDATLGVQSAALMGRGTPLQLLNLKTQSELLKNAMSDLEPVTKARINSLIGERAALERLAILTEQRATGLRNVATGPLGAQRGNAGLAVDSSIPSLDVGIMGSSAAANRPGESPMAFAERTGAADRSGEKIGKAAAREIGPLIALAAGIGRGSGGQAAVAGLAGLTGELSNVKALSSVATPLGIASGVLSGLTSLFGGGNRMKVEIDAYSQQALEQERQLRSDPLTTQYIVVGPTDRQTQYAQARLQRRDAVTRLP